MGKMKTMMALDIVDADCVYVCSDYESVCLALREYFGDESEWVSSEAIDIRDIEVKFISVSEAEYEAMKSGSCAFPDENSPVEYFE